VLDFSWAIVGNTAAKMLGDLGAEIIKIETGKRPAIERLIMPVRALPVAGGAPNNNPWFANIATSKRSFELDMSNPDSKPVIDALIQWADIVFENFSPGVLARLGMDYESVRARKPSIIMASGSIFGQTGPLGPVPGTETTGSARSGRVAMTGDPDRGPILPSATYGDSVTPFVLCSAMIGALMRRDTTGEGCRIDAAMVEVLVQQMLPSFIAAQEDMWAGGTGDVPRPGNRSSTASPHNVFPSLGDDQWVAIEVTTDAEFVALCDVIGRPELATDPRFLTLADRKANEEAIEALVAEFTRTLDPWAAMERLQRAGIGAGAVQRARDIVDRDPQMAHRQYLQTVDHSVLGPFAHQRTPIGFSDTPPRMFRAPRLGEHTEEICREVLGLGDRYADLAAKGVFQ
jgi:crotonobetainyl-CoA:carnitine CoA-transferase CaiB-like acyl-CoA transferase